MSDLINRQATIDAINVKNVNKGIISALQSIIEELPSAQTEHATCYLDSPCEYQNINIALPTAEPKKGKWTNDASCPFCGFQPWYERDIHTLSFCPNCGADMRGEERNEV